MCCSVGWKHLPSCYETPSGVHFTEIVFLWNIAKAFGLHEYATMQYSKMELNRENWDKGLTFEENSKKVSMFFFPCLFEYVIDRF